MSTRAVKFTRDLENCDQDRINRQQAVAENAPLREKVIAAMRAVYDPELPVNIYDLGLIYDLQINDDNDVEVRMTLTAPGCPVAGSLPGQVECAIRTVEGVNNANVELVWEPPWNQDRMSDEAKLALGLF